MHEVVVMIAQGSEEIEALSVVNVLRRGNVDVVLMSIHDDKRIVGARNIVIEADVTFDETLIRNAKSIVLPGGVEGTEHLLHFEPLRRILKEIQETHLIGAICAAPSILADVGILDGKHATSNPGYKEKVMAHPVLYSEETVVKDDRIITSRGMGTSLPFALELLESLIGKDIRKEVEQGVVMGSLVDYIKAVY
ncbi:hypothetical protein AOC36_07060 [Erysipelothrix larvae]|uniref:DJ-1/PfpI domain-containing protein n=1 Tax=Erysipelothrix larvae TaxID=1514105 RepID=A0A109UH79_9FIRM|nr:DJ-1 family glyoxalase III [Erysipelothrix larvae]AMC93751.1 hypothetical protein AOC36_07060 [Erysipelothrix larvae]